MLATPVLWLVTIYRLSHLFRSMQQPVLIADFRLDNVLQALFAGPNWIAQPNGNKWQLSLPSANGLQPLPRPARIVPFAKAGLTLIDRNGEGPEVRFKNRGPRNRHEAVEARGRDSRCGGRGRLPAVPATCRLLYDRTQRKNPHCALSSRANRPHRRGGRVMAQKDCQKAR